MKIIYRNVYNRRKYIFEFSLSLSLSLYIYIYILNILEVEQEKHRFCITLNMSTIAKLVNVSDFLLYFDNSILFNNSVLRENSINDSFISFSITYWIPSLFDNSMKCFNPIFFLYH